MIRALLACLLLVTVAAPPARAQGKDTTTRAEALNAEGKAKIKVVDFEGAAARFRAAIALVPDPRYYYNLCYTLDRAGKLREARAACEVVASGGADARLADKARARLVQIDQAIREGKDGQAAAVPGGAASTPLDAHDTLADGESVAPGKPGAAVDAPEAAPPTRRPPASARPAATAAAAGAPAPALQARPGSTFAFLFGVGSATMDQDPAAGGLLVASTTAVALGAGLDLWLGRTLGVEVDALVARRGADVSGVIDGQLVEGTLEFTYLDLEAAARIESGAGRFRPYGLGGGYLGIKAAAKASGMGMSADLENVAAVDVGLLLGGGLIFGGYHHAFSLDLRYQLGLTDVDSTDGFSSRHRVFMVMGGYAL